MGWLTRWNSRRYTRFSGPLVRTFRIHTQLQRNQEGERHTLLNCLRPSKSTNLEHQQKNLAGCHIAQACYDIPSIP